MKDNYNNIVLYIYIHYTIYYTIIIKYNNNNKNNLPLTVQFLLLSRKLSHFNSYHFNTKIKSRFVKIRDTYIVYKHGYINISGLTKQNVCENQLKLEKFERSKHSC